MSIKRKRQLAHAALYICLIIIAILTLFPLLWGISASLRDDKELYAYVMPFTIHTMIPVKFTLKSYVELFTKYGFLKPVINTVYVTGVSIFFGCILNSVLSCFCLSSFSRTHRESFSMRPGLTGPILARFTLRS